MCGHLQTDDSFYSSRLFTDYVVTVLDTDLYSEDSFTGYEGDSFSYSIVLTSPPTHEVIVTSVNPSAGEQPRPTAAAITPVENPYCSYRLTRVSGSRCCSGRRRPWRHPAARHVRRALLALPLRRVELERQPDPALQHHQRRGRRADGDLAGEET